MIEYALFVGITSVTERFISHTLQRLGITVESDTTITTVYMKWGKLSISRVTVNE